MVQLEDRIVSRDFRWQNNGSCVQFQRSNSAVLRALHAACAVDCGNETNFREPGEEQAMKRRKMTRILTVVAAALVMAGCGGGGGTTVVPDQPEIDQGEGYVIGAGDGLQVFVWGHEDLSTTISVRPDGNISTPLVEDMRAVGRTPTELARAMEEALAEYIRSPTVTIIVEQFVGEFAQQIRVVGEATEPKSLNFRSGMTLLDVMIEVGGLSEFASGNRAKVVRKQDGEDLVINVRVRDLLNRGDMSQNLRMQPGDVLIIPESIF